MLKTLFKDSLIYGTTSVLVKFFWLLSLPILTRFIAPEQFGILELVLLMVSMISPFITLESSQGFGRFYNLTEDVLQQKQWISSVLWFNVCMLAVFIMVGVAGSELWLKLVWQDAQGNTLWLIAIAYMSVGILFNLFSVFVRWQNQALDFLVMYVLQSLLGVGAATFMVFFYAWGIVELIICLSVGTLIAFLWGLWKNRQWIIFQIDTNKLKQMLSYSLPLIPTVMTFALVTWIDRVMITQMLGLKELGIYSTAFRMAGVGGMIVIGFQFALGPYVFQRYDEPETPRNLANLFRFVVCLTLAILMFLGLFAEELISRFIGKNYAQSVVLFLPLAIATCLSQLTMFTPGLAIRKKTWTMFYIYAIAVIINIALNFFLISLFGLWGAVCATLLGSVIIFVTLMFFNQKHYPIPYSFSLYFWALLYAFGAYLVGLFLPFEGAVEWMIKLLLWGGMIACFFMIKIIRVSDLQRLQVLIMNKLS